MGWLGLSSVQVTPMKAVAIIAFTALFVVGILQDKPLNMKRLHALVARRKTRKGPNADQ